MAKTKSPAVKLKQEMTRDRALMMRPELIICHPTVILIGFMIFIVFYDFVQNPANQRFFLIIWAAGMPTPAAATISCCVFGRNLRKTRDGRTPGAAGATSGARGAGSALPQPRGARAERDSEANATERMSLWQWGNTPEPALGRGTSPPPVPGGAVTPHQPPGAYLGRGHGGATTAPSSEQQQQPQPPNTRMEHPAPIPIPIPIPTPIPIPVPAPPQ